MSAMFTRVVNVRPGEARRLVPFFSVIVMSSFACQSAEVVATSLFVSSLGTGRMPLLGAATMGMVLLVSILFSRIAYRFARETLLQATLGANALLLLLARASSALGLPDELFGLVLYPVSIVQMWLISVAFWPLLNSLYDVSTASRLFPLIASGGLLGSILGNWFAGAMPSLLAHGRLKSADILVVGGFLLLAGARLVARISRDLSRHPVKRHATGSEERGLLDACRTSLMFLRDVPMFRILMGMLILHHLINPIIPYHLLSQAHATLHGEGRLQSFYGGLKASTTTLTLLMQVFVAGRLLHRLGVRSALTILPAFLLAGSIMAFGISGLTGAVALMVMFQLFDDSVNTPARLAINSLIPEARRGQLVLVLANYLPALGMMFGNLILYGIISCRQARWIDDSALVSVYLSLVMTLAAGWLVLSFSFRRAYGGSTRSLAA